MQGDHKDTVRRGSDAVSESYRADDAEPPEYMGWLLDLHTRLSIAADIHDLGCGCGVPAARTLADAGHGVTGIDISTVQIDRARQLVPHARFIEADAADLSFAPETFNSEIRGVRGW